MPRPSDLIGLVCLPFSVVSVVLSLAACLAREVENRTGLWRER